MKIFNMNMVEFIQTLKPVLLSFISIFMLRVVEVFDIVHPILTLIFQITIGILTIIYLIKKTKRLK